MWPNMTNRNNGNEGKLQKRIGRIGREGIERRMALTLPTKSCVRVSLPGGGRPSGVGLVEVAIFITASTSSLVGIVPFDGALVAEEAIEEATVLGLPLDEEATLPDGLWMSEGLEAACSRHLSKTSAEIVKVTNNSHSALLSARRRPTVTTAYSGRLSERWVARGRGVKML